MKNKVSAKLRKKIKRGGELRRRRKLERRTAAWARSLELTGGASGLVGAVGVPLLRLLAPESGLRDRLSAALTVAGFVPGHDRGQVLVDVAVGLALGAVSVRGAMEVLAQAGAACGPAASAVTARRALEELDAAALEEIARARSAHRRVIWQRLAARPQGFGVGAGSRARLGRVDRHRRGCVPGRNPLRKGGRGADL